MKRAGLYMRVSTVDQHPETQLHDLRQMAAQRGYEIVQEYTDRISGAKARRPGLDQMMADARRGRFDVVLVWASDRIARSVKHFLEVLDELNRIGVEYVRFREQIDTGGPLGRAIVVIIGAVAELERNLIIERVRAGMRRARLEGQRIGRAPLVLDNLAIQQDRQRGQSIREIAKGTCVSRRPRCNVSFGNQTAPMTVKKQPYISRVTKGVEKPLAKPHITNGRISTIRPCQKVWVEKQRLIRRKQRRSCNRQPKPLSDSQKLKVHLAFNQPIKPSAYSRISRLTGQVPAQRHRFRTRTASVRARFVSSH